MRGGETLRKVLRFTAKQWTTRKGLVGGIALSIGLATLTEVIVPVYAGRLVDALAPGGAGVHAAVSALAVMAALGLAMAGLRHLAWWGIVPMTLGMMRNIAQDSFHRVQRFSTDWHANTFAGSTVRRITRGMWALDTLNDILLLALWPSLVVLVATVVLLMVRWPAVGSIMALGSLAFVTLTILFSTRVIAPAARLSNALDTRMGGALSDSLAANAVVKSFGAEAGEDARFAQLSLKWDKRTRRVWKRAVLSGTGQIVLLWLVRTGVTAAAIWLWSQGRATPGDIAYVLTMYFVVHGYLREIGQHVHNLQRSVNEMEEMVELYEQPFGIADARDAAPLRIAKGEIGFEHVTFGYQGQKPLFRELSVRIAPGERVGLVGHSGSGKTTFVKLIQRLYDVTGGCVLIDGHNIARATQASLRSQIAVVQQEPVLFHRSLAENIAYARPSATLAEVEHAARLANAHEFINRLPRQYRTLVGERGVKLSGGERQRVALARAFLADAPVLILDEATSSLDSESEALIQEAMERLIAGRTAIIIAHRLSTVRAVDRILVFDQGRIVEEGSHESLLRRPGGHYRRLLDRATTHTSTATLSVGTG